MSEIIRRSNSPHYLPRICDILRRYHLLPGWHHQLHYAESYQKVPVNESLKNSQCWYLNIVREFKKCQLRALMKPNLHDKNSSSSLNTYQSNSLTMRNISSMCKILKSIIGVVCMNNIIMNF